MHGFGITDSLPTQPLLSLRPAAGRFPLRGAARDVMVVRVALLVVHFLPFRARVLALPRRLRLRLRLRLRGLCLLAEQKPCMTEIYLQFRCT